MYTVWKSRGMGRNLPAGGVFRRTGPGDDGKVRALVAALGGGFWTWWFWLGVAGLGLIVPMLLKPWVNRSSGIPAVLAACGASLVGVLMLRFFILYAGQLTVA